MKPDRAISVPSTDVGAGQQASHRIPDAVPYSVIVPHELCAEVLRALVAHVTQRARVDGVAASPACSALLSALYAASRNPDGRVAGDGNDEVPPARLDVTGMSTVARVAEESGFPPRTIRYWAARGRITACRVGRVWLIDPESLKERT